MDWIDVLALVMFIMLIGFMVVPAYLSWRIDKLVEEIKELERKDGRA